MSLRRVVRMTNSPVSSSDRDSSSFHLLDARIQRWIWQSGWTELKDAQESAIPVILEGKRDVIIAAATASGKTEAAFLPILTRILSMKDSRACVLYVSPLKALINDQWDRLDRLCEHLDITVTPWHGDISDAKKRAFIKRPSGCVLITPESLEGFLMTRGHGLAGVLHGLVYCVVDELHAFIDTERGKQLQSLLHRIDVALERMVPRIALSATLGEMGLAAEFLRPGNGGAVQIIESREHGQELKVLVKGYENLPPKLTDEESQAKQQQGGAVEMEDETAQGVIAISKHLFRTLRGANHLVFPNSRRNVELYADLLRRACERAAVPNEFWPHHGSLAKPIREEAEAALKSGDRPATAICTTTLELGIDIGSVKSVAQIGPAPSVASLRQRLGRSGRRRGEPAILRCYCLEEPPGADLTLSDQLREGLVQAIAQIRLLVQGWYEPPRIHGAHFSTLVQQLISVIAQYGGVTASKAWEILCGNGVFDGITKTEFSDLLRALGAKDVLMQDSTGLLLLGGQGERIANHYSFYAAFTSEEEFRIVSAGKTLGSLPVSRPVEKDSYIIFAGRRWKVVDCHQAEKVIEVVPAQGGKPPLFDGMGGKVHNAVRMEMRLVLSTAEPIRFLDQQATAFLAEARSTYAKLGLGSTSVLQMGSTVMLFTWRGDWVNDTLMLMLARNGLRASNEGMYVAVYVEEAERVNNILEDIAADGIPAPEALAHTVKNNVSEKWDWLLPEDLLCKTFASRELDVEGAHVAVQSLVSASQGHSAERSGR